MEQALGSSTAIIREQDEKLADLETTLAARTSELDYLDGELKRLQAEFRHYQGRPAVPGKPLEIQSRDELLAVVRGMEALVQNAESMAQTNAAMARKLKEMETSLEAVKAHAISQDCGRLCDSDPQLAYREQWKRSEAYVDGLIRQGLSPAKPSAPTSLPALAARHDFDPQN